MLIEKKRGALSNGAPFEGLPSATAATSGADTSYW
jgi:hypothetical protein